MKVAYLVLLLALPACAPSRHRIKGLVDRIDRIKTNNPNMSVKDFLTDAQALTGTVDPELIHILSKLEKNNPGLTLDGAAYTLEVFESATRPVADQRDACSGFGIRLPVVAVRFRNYVEPISTTVDDGTVHQSFVQDTSAASVPVTETADVRGPVQSGIGAGYHWSLQCWPQFGSIGPSVSAFSQGFDPQNGTFQFGAALGFQVSIKKVFRFGIDIGYDLIRFERANSSAPITSNGLFAFKNLGGPSLSYMFTLEVGLGSADEPK